MPYQETLPKIQDLINELLIVLSDKEKFIIENRFSLNEKPRLTLESIGKKYQVTRERVRQIEKNALKKLERNVGNTSLNEITAVALDIVTEHGGIVEEEKLVAEIVKRSKSQQSIDVSSLKLTIDLEKNIEHMHNTIQFKPYWKLKAKTISNIKIICDLSFKILCQAADVMSAQKLAQAIESAMTSKESIAFIISCFDLDRRLKVLDNGSVGLSSWRTINPKTLRDKIYFVMKQLKEPLHYAEIAKHITNLINDYKQVNVQAVHNELIRHNGFVLIGRGIYALQEWGYTEGTVAEVIADILSKKGPMKRDDIVNEVLQLRQVKKITIQLNLKNKEQFERVGRDTYQLISQKPTT